MRFSAAAVGATALTVTLLSQHPNTSFDRLRRLDRLGVFVPNWRFFAPHPATHDFHLLHRTLDVDDQVSPWIDTTEISPRRPTQAVWFPGRRAEKAVFDVASEFVQSLSLSHEQLSRFPSYSAIVAKVRHAVLTTEPDAEQRLQGFQFLVARHGGVDPEARPEYLYLSAFIPMEPDDDR